MNSGVAIIYNGQDLFYPQPTPFVALDEKSIYYSELWAKEETLTLEGQLTGCTFAAISAAQMTLSSRLNKSYQTLEIWQYKNGASGKVFQKDLVEIKSIDYSNSRWIGVMPYTISLSCYPSGYFSGVFGVLNPVDKWDYQEGANLALEATHTVSCQGFNTSPTLTNALQNAKNWVYGKTGLNANSPLPAFIQNANGPTFVNLELHETIDRLNGTYSITERYTNDLTRSGYGVVRYTTAASSGNNLLTVALNGTVEGGNLDIVRARNAFTGLSAFGMAANSYQSLFGLNDLNPRPLSQNVVEDPYNATIQFGFVFNNDNSPDLVFDYTVKMASGTNIVAQIDGDIIARGGDLTNRFNRAKAYAQTVDLYALVVPFYSDFYPYASTAPLNTRPTVSGVTYAPSEGTVSLTATFTNQEQVSNGLDSFEYTIDFQPPVERIDVKPKLDGVVNSPSDLYSLVDLNYKNRAAISIRGNAIINEGVSVAQGVGEIKAKLMTLMTTYSRLTSIVLDQEEITFDRTDQRAVSFSVAWSFDSPNIVATTPYSSVNTLQV